FFFSSRRRHTRSLRDWSSDVCSSDLLERLYREQGDRLWRAVFLYSGDRELAGDAVAEAFAQALRRGDSIESARSWVWHVSFRIRSEERRVGKEGGAWGRVCVVKERRA